MPNLNIPRTRDLLEKFDFTTLFVEELNWSRPVARRPGAQTQDGVNYTYRHIAELGGVVVLEIETEAGDIPSAKIRDAIQRVMSTLYRENLVVFVDKARTQSLWRWVKREDKKTFPREHLYVKGQPGDLFISKVSGMVFDISRFDELGNVSLIHVADALKNALDVERVTKQFFRDYDAERGRFTELIEGIPDERMRRWYASILLNRLMFIYFLQRKFLVDNGETEYLQKKLEATSKEFGKDYYYAKFLTPLFFEGFAKPARERSAEARQRLGTVPYLNGGLFLEHRIEAEYRGKIAVPDEAFRNLLALFERYSWNLDDTPEGHDDEINPDVLGYIFEKYINQKEFGAYYTRPEITEYLCEHTIHQLILDQINSTVDLPGISKARHYDSLPDLLLDLNAQNCRRLLYDILPKLSLLDPACGSGAFLVAAMKTLVNIYSAVTGRIEYLSDDSLKNWLAQTRKDHRSLNYHIKRKIITENLFGVDIMEEAADIARLRLFLALVSSVKTVDELEPLPNIDFNILAGNSLIGLIHVSEKAFDGKAQGALQFHEKTYAELVQEKNRLIAIYRGLAEQKAYQNNLQALRDDIQGKLQEAGGTLNAILLDEFQSLGIRYEAAKWNVAAGKEDKPVKRPLRIGDIQELHPFHWGYQFDHILNERGGFDAIITNPPWEIFKPQAKEFLTDFAAGITKNKMTIKEFEERQAEALKDDAVRAKWEAYLSRFPHISAYYRTTPQYKNQISIVNGKKAGSDINLYKLFTEQCFNLLRKGGQCGIVLPSGLYTDLGAKQLRELLFEQTEITGLFGFENRKEIFEGVHRSFKFIVFTFGKGGKTERFPASFMRHDVSELRDFPRRGSLPISIKLIRRLSPDSLSVMEFKSDADVQIAEKMLAFPQLGTWYQDKPLQFSREFMSSDDHGKFNFEGDGLIVYEGKMFEQFTHNFDKPQWWMSEKELSKTHFYERGDWRHYRFAIRRIASNTNNRTLIATVLPKNTVVVHSVFVNVKDVLSAPVTLYIVALLNSFVLDYALRAQVTSNVSQFFIHQLSMPRLVESDHRFKPIVERAARLICTTLEFDDLAREVGLTPLSAQHWGRVAETKSGVLAGVGAPGGREAGLSSAPSLFAPEQPALGDLLKEESNGSSSPPNLRTNHERGTGGEVYGVTDPIERARLRAELDGLIAHLYGLTEAEFAHILGTFPLVAELIKVAAQNAYRDAARGLIQ